MNNSTDLFDCRWLDKLGVSAKEGVGVVMRQTFSKGNTGRERLIRSHSSARFCFELSGNSN